MEEGGMKGRKGEGKGGRFGIERVGGRQGEIQRRKEKVGMKDEAGMG